jgi:hypothetical protein
MRSPLLTCSHSFPSTLFHYVPLTVFDSVPPTLFTCVYVFRYYFNFEVLECSWDELVKDIESSQDLDQVIGAHEKFLSVLTNRSVGRWADLRAFRRGRRGCGSVACGPADAGAGAGAGGADLAIDGGGGWW